MGKAVHITRRRGHYGGSSPAMFPLFRLGGLARSQISARIGARQSNRRGNLSRGVFPYPEKCVFLRIRLIRRNLARRRQNGRRTPLESKKSDFPQVRWRRRLAQNMSVGIECRWAFGGPPHYRSGTAALLELRKLFNIDLSREK